MQHPYLSIVTLFRNDDYSGGLSSKVRIGLLYLLKKLAEYNIDAEIIVVDWNTPEDRPKFKDIFTLPGPIGNTAIRVIEVPPNIHQRYQHADKAKIHGAVAYNVGIRRAAGEYCIIKVSDSFWSDGVFKYIAGKNLEANTLYRCNRVDVEYEIEGDLLNSDFDPRSLESKLASSFSTINYPLILANGLPPLHTNASGDFQLMAKKNWMEQRGYYETKDCFSLHVDAILCFCAHAAGIKEIRLNDQDCVYKIKHDGMFQNRLQERLDIFPRYVNKLPLPVFMKNKLNGTYEKVYKDLHSTYYMDVKVNNDRENVKFYKSIIEGKINFILNSEEWGLINDNIQEFSIN